MIPYDPLLNLFFVVDRWYNMVNSSNPKKTLKIEVSGRNPTSQNEPTMLEIASSWTTANPSPARALAKWWRLAAPVAELTTMFFFMGKSSERSNCPGHIYASELVFDLFRSFRICEELLYNNHLCNGLCPIPAENCFPNLFQFLAFFSCNPKGADSRRAHGS